MCRCLTRRSMVPVLTLVVAAAVLATSSPVAAQTAFVPYYGKNQVRYDKFDWQVYTTEHFQLYYYPATQPQIERVAGYAESAYQQISADLKHDLAFKVPMILFQTHSEFEQENVIPGAVSEGVGAFAESERNRMLLPMDEPADLLYRLIVHELTHVFQFDIIPQSLIRQSAPLWVSEGQADYSTGLWRPLDLMMVRDAAIADIIPQLSEMEGYGNTNNPRLVYNLGHAAFEFIESRWGKEGIRQFLFAMRKSVIGGGENAYMEAFQIGPEEFDRQFDRYLKARFKPFRDKETPGDYGRDLAPSRKRTTFVGAYTVEPSPSGDLLAVASGNMRDQEMDIILVSAKDGKVIRHLTSGFDQGMGFDYIVTPGNRWITIPWLTWSPVDDRLAYIARKEKGKVLIVQNVVTRKIEQRVDLGSVDEPESPAFSPDGRRVAFSGMRDAVADIFVVDLATKAITNITKDEFGDYGPTYSPDGSFIVYMARVSGNEKLFRVDLATGKKTQLTFGTHDDAAARFLNAKTIVFPSTATDPNLALEAEVARNGATYNLWTLDLENGELDQWTDALGGNFSPVVLKDGTATKIAFVSYYKGEYGLHMFDRKDPLLKANAADFGAPGPVIDFQAPLTHTFLADNKKKKGGWSTLSLDGRPAISLGVTSGTDLFGGTTLSFTDVLGERGISLYAASMSQYRQMAVAVMNQGHRFQYAVQGYWYDTFYYGQNSGLLYDDYYSNYIDRDMATATRSMRGVTAFGMYPFNRYQRLEVAAGFAYVSESYNDSSLQQLAQDYQQALYGTSIFRSGYYMPLNVAFVQETTLFREFGPLSGNTVKLGYEYAVPINNLAWQTVEVDARKYVQLAGSSLLALRAKGFRSWGKSPSYTYFGGNSEMHGYDYLEFIGSNGYFVDAELRFPLIDAMATPIGILGGVRGVFFFNVGAAWFAESNFKFASKTDEIVTPVTGSYYDDNYNLVYTYGDAVDVSGFRLVDGRAAYGFGLETFALGFPIHFDWSWRTLFNKAWEDVLFASAGGSSTFRKPRFQFWIGYDF
jgi:hypothetical protein